MACVIREALVRAGPRASLGRAGASRRAPARASRLRAREARRRMRRNRRASRRRCISSASGARGCPRWRSSRCRRATACPAPTRGLARSSTPSAKPEPRASSGTTRDTSAGATRTTTRARRRGADPRRPAGFGRGVQRRPRRQRRGGVRETRRHRVFARAQWLTRVTRGRAVAAVAGTHGKTSTSAALAVALRSAGLDVSAVVGGNVPQFPGGRKPSAAATTSLSSRRTSTTAVPRARTRRRGVAERGARPPGHVQRRARSGGHVRAVRAPRPPRRARRGVWGRRERPRARRDARGSGRRASGRFSGRSSGSSRRGGGFVRDLRVRRRQRVARGGRARGRAHGRVLVHRHAQRRVRVGDVRPGGRARTPRSTRCAFVAGFEISSARAPNAPPRPTDSFGRSPNP